MRWIKYALIILGGLAVICLVLIAIVLFTLDNDDYRRLVIRGVAHFTGYQMTIDGPFTLELSAAPSLSAEAIRIDPGIDGPLPPVSKIGKFKIQIALWHLIRGIVVIKELRAEDVVGAVIIATEAEPEDRSDSARKVTPDIEIPIVESVRLRNIHLDVIDKAADRAVEIRLEQFDVDDIRNSGPLFVKGHGSVNGNDFKLDGKLGALSAIFKGAQPYPVYLNISTTGFNLSARGTIEDLLDGEGVKLRLAGEAGELSHLFQLLQMEVPPLGNLNVEATVIHDFSAPGLSDLHVSLTGDSRIEFTVDGSVENLFSGKGANIRFSGSFANPDIFKILLPEDLPALKQIRVAGEVRETEGALAVENLTVDAAAEQGLVLTINGRLGLDEIISAPAITETALNLALSMPSTELLKSYVIESLPEMGPVTAHARLTGLLERMSLEDIAVEAGGSGPVRVISRGRIGRLPSGGDMIASEIDLTASIEADNTHLLTSGLGIEVPDFGSLTLHTRIRGSSNQFQLAEIDARTTHAQGLTAALSGNVGFEQDKKAGLIGKVALEARIDAPTTRAALAPLGVTNLPNLKPVRVSAQIAGTTRALSIEEVALSVGRYSPMRMEVKGRVGQVPLAGDRPISDVKVTASFSANTTAALSSALGVTMPDFGSLQASGSITDRNGIYRMRDVNIAIGNQKKPAVKVTGAIASVVKGYELSVDGIDLTVAARDLLLQPFSELLGRPLPDLGSLSGKFRLSGSQTKLAISKIKLSTATPQGLTMTASGDIKHIGLASKKPLKGVAVAFSARAPQLGAVPGLAGLGLPDLVPLQLKARVSDRRGSLDVETFDIRSGKGDKAFLRIQGKILRIDVLKQMRLQANLETASQPWITKYLQRTPAENYPLAGAIMITGADDGMSINELRFGTSDEKLLVMRARGRLSHLSKSPEIDLQFIASAPDPAAVGSMIDVSLPPLGPLAIDGRINGSPQNVAFRGKTRIGETNFTSSVNVALAAARPRIDAGFSAATVNLKSMGIYPEAPPAASAAGSQPKRPKSDRLFDDTPLPLEVLKAVDLYFALDADKLVARNVTTNDLDLGIRLENGRLRIHPASLAYAAGFTELEVIVDASGPTPEFVLKITGEDIDIEEVENYAHSPLILSGALNLVVDLHSAGKSAREIAANLGGEFNLALENGRIRRIVDFLSADAFDLVLSTADRRKYTDLQCLVNKIQFEKGVGTIEIFSMNTPKTRVGGAGNINLAEERIDVAITPEKKRRLFKRGSAVQIKGPLANPKIRTLPGKEAVRIYGNILMPYVFLPARALGSLVGLIRNDKDATACVFK
jgi:uncharacterized protein involved in outer membrane biogenesis